MQVGTSGLCHFFMSGNCRYGERCRNIHGVPLPPLHHRECPRWNWRPSALGIRSHRWLGSQGQCEVCHAFCLDPRDPEGADGTAERSEQSKTPNQTAAGCAPSPPAPSTESIRRAAADAARPEHAQPPARSMRSGTAPLLRAAAARAEHRRKCAAEKARNLVVPGGGVSTADPECAIWCGSSRSLRAARASAIDAGMGRWFRARGPTGAQCVVRMAWFDLAALSIS
jgi:hypothetical protein